MNNNSDNMKLKVKRIGGSLTVIIPRDVASLYSITEDTQFDVVPISKDELVLKYKRDKTLSD